MRILLTHCLIGAGMALAAALAFPISPTSADRATPAMERMISAEEKFRQAGGEHRSAPFWSWNDDLDPQELRRQIRSMHEAGMGGFFMHARAGLLTPYLGKKYMECHAAAIDEARRLGMGAWLYDEDRWPSGPAGGIIPAKGPAYRNKWLEIKETKGGAAETSILAAFTYRKDGGRIIEASPAPLSELENPSAELLVFQVGTGGYVSLLNEQVVAAFIDSTHETFKKSFGPAFGKTVPGIFTDEPGYYDEHPPWSNDFANEFQKRRGYDILPKLPAIFYDIGDDYMKVRHDFWHTVTELYVGAFSKQIGQWCAENNLIFTGHQSPEESLRVQVGLNGSAMRHYEHMQMPGIDHLGRGITQPVGMKQVTSVAEQFGGRRALSEMFAGTGWGVSFEELKRIAEWQYSLGINFMCEHLALYSLKGCRKRDYPPSIGYQQPWWPDYEIFEDHFARLGAALTSGQAVADVLVIHPIESAWCVYSPIDRGRADRLYGELIRVCRSLQEMHADFHFGDQSMLERFGRVENGRLRLGDCAYSLVVIPPSVSIDSSTLALLREWITGGGTVIVVGDIPPLVDGVPSDEPARILNAQPRVENDFARIRAAIRAALRPRIQVLDTSGADARTIYCRQRDLGEKQLFFLVNLDETAAYNNAIIRIPGQGAVEEWDLDRGEIRPITCTEVGEDTVFELRFEPTQSHLIAFDPSRKPEVGRPERWTTTREQPLAGRWAVKWHDPNALTLDYCRYRIGDGVWSERTPTILLGAKLAHLEEETPVTLRFTFNADFSRPKRRGITLVMERPEEYEISVNGHRVQYKDAGWWTDISFRKIGIDELVRQGENVIELKCNYLGETGRQRRRAALGVEALKARMWTHPPAGAKDAIILPYSGEVEETIRLNNELKYGLELESVYLIGEFGVYRDGKEFVLRDRRWTAETGDLVEQGAPFFSGRFTLRQRIPVERRPGERVILALDRPGAVVTKVRVNGRSAGSLVWRPMELDVTDLLVSGENTFEFEMANSCRNLLGPHHRQVAEADVSPGSWAEVRTDAYALVPTGLTSAPKLVFRRRN